MVQFYAQSRSLGYTVKGLDPFYHYSKEGNAKAREFFKQTLGIDPEYSHAVTMLAFTHFIDASMGFTGSRAESIKRAVELAKKAIALDDYLIDADRTTLRLSTGYPIETYL